jgi:hypothetical protein
MRHTAECDGVKCETREVGRRVMRVARTKSVPFEEHLRCNVKHIVEHAANGGSAKGGHKESVYAGIGV